MDIPFQEKEKQNLVLCLDHHLHQLKNHGNSVKTIFHSYNRDDSQTKKNLKKMVVISDKVFFVDMVFLAEPNDCEHSIENIMVGFKTSDVLAYLKALVERV